MLVAEKTWIGEWNMSLDHRNRWWVTHRPSESQWHVYGPYESKEEAAEESGMPKPKTELEEVWELAAELNNVVARAKFEAPYPAVYFDSVKANSRFNGLVWKYGKNFR